MQIDIILPSVLIVLGILLISAELVLGLDSLFDLALSGLALALGGLLGAIFSSWELAVLISIVGVVAYWLAARAYVHRIFKTRPHKMNTEKLVGEVVKISRESKDGSKHFIKLHGEEWLVDVAHRAKVGDEIEITAVKGTKVVAKLVTKS